MPPGCFHFTSSTAGLEVPSKFALPSAATTATPVTTQAPATTATPATTAQGAYTVPLCIGTSHQCLLANLYHDSSEPAEPGCSTWPRLPLGVHVLVQARDQHQITVTALSACSHYSHTCYNSSTRNHSSGLHHCGRCPSAPCAAPVMTACLPIRLAARPEPVLQRIQAAAQVPLSMHCGMCFQ